MADKALTKQFVAVCHRLLRAHPEHRGAWIIPDDLLREAIRTALQSHRGENDHR